MSVPVNLVALQGVFASIFGPDDDFVPNYPKPAHVHTRLDPPDMDDDTLDAIAEGRAQARQARRDYFPYDFD